jgi:hypothetical protein
MKTMLPLALGAFLLLSAGESVLAADVRCSDGITASDAHTPNLTVRADSILFCVNEDSDRAILFFRASAMVNRSFPDYNSAPWLALRVFDDQGQEIFADPTFWVATVAPCGGYHPHAIAVPRKFDFEEAYSIEVQLTGNVGGRTNCGTRPSGFFEAAWYDVQNKVDKWRRLEFSEAEKMAIKAYFSGGGAAAGSDGAALGGGGY